MVGFFLLTSFLNFTRSFKEFTHPNAQYLYRQVDFIVVLTGGKGRLLSALNLFHEIEPRGLFISGVGRNVTLRTLFFNVNVSEPERSKIYIEDVSKSTFENAAQTKKFILDHSVRSIVLVTSTYHMKRSLYIFKKVMPKDLLIYPFAIESENFDTDAWWRSFRSTKIAFEEYFKYLWYRWVGRRLFSTP